MKRLENMKENLMGAVQGQLCDLHNADAKELGEAVDMIKDLSEAIYYCTITEAMNKKEKEAHSSRYYPVTYTAPTSYYGGDRDMDRNMGRMYYDGNGNNSGSRDSGNMSSTRQYPVYMDMRDEREGRSPMTRRTYMESKEMHKDKKTKMHELEKYMKELTDDMIEMIEDASPEEKDLLEKRVAGLANKLAQI